MRKVVILYLVLWFVHFGILATDLSTQPSAVGPTQQGTGMAIIEHEGIEEEILLKGKITSSFGKVEVRKPGSILWQKARIGQGQETRSDTGKKQQGQTDQAPAIPAHLQTKCGRCGLEPEECQEPQNQMSLLPR